MKRHIELTIDFNLKKYDTIRLKQMDTTEFVFKIIYCGLNVDLSNNTVNIIFTKPNNTIVIQSENITTEGNIITATLLADCVRNSGSAKMEVEIKDTNNNVVSSFYINLFIESTSKNNITSENTPNYIEQMDKAVKDLQQKGESTIQQINEDYDTIVDDVNQIIDNYENIQNDVNNTISEALKTINQFNIVIVETLPEANIDMHTIYFVLKDSNQDEQEQNVYNEYIYVNGKWELIGNTGVNILLASQTEDGLMSKEDKAKLDILEKLEIIQEEGEATTENVYSAIAVKNIVEKINKTKLDSSIMTQINSFANEAVTNYSGYNNSYYYKHGSKVHIHLGIKIDTTEFITIFTMPEGFRPKSLTGALGIGSSPINFVGIQIDTIGRIQTQTSNGYCNADIEFDVFN